MSLVGVLVFIYQNIAELVLVVAQGLWIGLEQFQGLHDQVVEVHDLVALQTGLVLLVDVCHYLFKRPAGNFGVLLWLQQAVFGVGNLGQDVSWDVKLGIQVQLAQDPLDQGQLLGRVGN